MTPAIPNGDAEMDALVEQHLRRWGTELPQTMDDIHVRALDRRGRPVTTLERRTETRQVRDWTPRAHACHHDGLPFRRAGEPL